MSLEADALNAAAAQVLSLVEETKRSNVRFVHAANTGGPDALVLHPTPAVTAWSDDLVVIADLTAANVTAAPTLRVSDLAPIPITWASGAPISPGDMAGAILFKIHGSAQAGYVAHIMSRSTPRAVNVEADNPTPWTKVIASGVWMDGELVSSSGIAAVTQLTGGQHHITFDHNIGAHYGVVGASLHDAGLGGWVSQINRQAASGTSCDIQVWGLYLGLPAGLDNIDFAFVVIGG